MRLSWRQRQPEHVVAFYEADDFLVQQVASFISDGLAANEHVIVIATIQHWNAIAARLEAGSMDYGRATGEGRLVLIEADEALDTLMLNGSVDVDRFRAMLEPLIRADTRTRVYGELVSLLAQRGDVDAALAIERLGHELAHTMKIGVLCAYQVHAARSLDSVDIARIEEVHDRSFFENGSRHLPAVGAAPTAEQGPLHAVRFYENRESLATMVGHFLGEGLVVGLPAVVIATPEHREAIRKALTDRFFDIPRLEKAGDLMMVDAEATLSQFMVGGMPHPLRFRAAIVPLIEQAGRGRAGGVIRAYGEMVDVLWKAGHTVAAVRLETLWNQLAHSHSFALLCGYSMGHFYKDAAQQAICDLHTHVISEPPESVGLH